VSVYLDTSALAKLVLVEAETRALRDWLAARPDVPRVTNVIGEVELQRLATRVSQPAVSTARQLLARLDRLDLTPATLLRAAQFPPPEVRTLDAFHLASASELVDLVAVVTYDLRMVSAAASFGLPVVSPGAAQPAGEASPRPLVPPVSEVPPGVTPRA